MSFQDLLTKDYSKNVLPSTVRFIIILGNLFLFLRYSGWYHDGYYGPNILSSDVKPRSVRNAIKHISILDMTAVILAILVAVKQLSFKRPEIDSFKEIMTFPACERKWTIVLLLFSILKFIYQQPSDVTDKTGRMKNWLTKWLKMNKNLSKEGVMSYENDDYTNEEWECILSNLLLIISSSICVISSFSFKYTIKRAERELQIFVLQYSEIILLVVIIFDLTILLFISDTKYLGVLLLVALLFDVIRISRYRYSSKRFKNQTLDISDYTVSLKWLSITTFGIVLFSGYFAYLLEMLGYKKTDYLFRVSSYFMLYYRNEYRPSGTVRYLYARRLFWNWSF